MARRIELIRHGLPEGGSRYRGHSLDDPLSATGWQQMWQAVGERHDWDQIITSPMSRCRDFAEQLAQRYGLPVAVHHDLREVGFGEWEGQTRAELQQHRAQEYRNFYADPVHNTPPGAEPAEAFKQRVSLAFETILRDYPTGDLLLVAHAGVIRAVACHVIGASAAGMYKIRVENAAILKLQQAEQLQVLSLS